jgi:NTP pyrophosphatase (non-canonical NTP hydrolase)
MREYIAFARKRWSSTEKPERYDLRDDFIMTAGLAGEAGEVVEVLKKAVRRNPKTETMTLSKDDRANLILELGDVMYYWTIICDRHDINIKDVLEANVAKLMARKQHK